MGIHTTLAAAAHLCAYCHSSGFILVSREGEIQWCKVRLKNISL